QHRITPFIASLPRVHTFHRGPQKRPPELRRNYGAQLSRKRMCCNVIHHSDQPGEVPKHHLQSALPSHRHERL
ncbi:hypothetical protein HispidOSU_018927, partial [Sigmodon hispidus]